MSLRTILASEGLIFSNLSKISTFPTKVHLSDLDAELGEGGMRSGYKAIWPTNASPDLQPLSMARVSVFYLTPEGYLVVVLASKRKALLWVAEGYGSLNGRWTDTTSAWRLAKERKSIVGCLKENADAVEMGSEPLWAEISVLP